MNDKTIKDILLPIKKQIDIFAEAEKDIKNILKLEEKNKICDIRVTVFSKIKIVYINLYVIFFCIKQSEDSSNPFWSYENQYFDNMNPKGLLNDVDMFLKISFTLSVFSCIEQFVTELYKYHKKEDKLPVTEKRITEKLKQLTQHFDIKENSLKNYESFEAFRKVRNALHTNFISDEDFNYESNEIKIKFRKGQFIKYLTKETLLHLQQENIDFLKDIIERFGDFDKYIEEPAYQAIKKLNLINNI